MSGILELDLEDPRLTLIMRALASKTRVKILRMLPEELCITEIAERLRQTDENIGVQVRRLEKGDLSTPRYRAGRRGVRKGPQRKVNTIIIHFSETRENETSV